MIPYHLSSQSKIYKIESVNVFDFVKQEKNFKGGKITNSEFKSAFTELSCISYIRSDNSIPDMDLIFKYVFYKKDSLLKEIQYE